MAVARGRIILFLLLSALCGHATAGEQFVDDSSQTVEISAPFKRIISLYAAHTENLFTLGLDSEIIGVSKSDEYPLEALKKPRFSYRDDPERLMALRPDLVLIRPMIFRGYRAFVASLQAAGVTVVSLQPNTIEEMFVYWKQLGTLTGKPRKAEEMIQHFSGSLKVIRDRVAHILPSDRPGVYFEAIHRKMKTFSPRSISMFVLESAGGMNIAQDAKPVRGTNIAAYGKEKILARARDIDVYLAQKGIMNRVSVEEIFNESGFGAIKAVREKNVFLVDEVIVARPTMRLLKGIRTIQDLIYPELEKRVISLREKRAESAR